MISPSDFYRMNCAERAELLLQQGTYLQSWREDSLIVDLFELSDLLVELFYQYPTDELVSISAYPSSGSESDLFKKDFQPRLLIKRHPNQRERQNNSFAA